MLHIIKNDYFLTDFVMDALNDRADVRVLAHRRAPVTSLRRAMKPWAAARCRADPDNPYFPPEYLERLQAIPARDDVLFFDVDDLKDLLILRPYIAAPRPWVWLWNPVRDFLETSREARQFGERLRAEGFRLATFDPRDAGEHDFRLLPQVYRQVELPATPGRASDVFFVGREKNRLATLLEWKDALQQLGLRTDCHIVRDRGVRHTSAQLDALAEQPLPYDETLRRIAGTRAILEILQRGQSGLSVRCLEAFFLGKKLITDNHGIVDSPLYHPDQVFVIGEDDPRELASFLDRPTPPAHSAALASFDVRHWVDNFKTPVSPARVFAAASLAAA